MPRIIIDPTLSNDIVSTSSVRFRTRAFKKDELINNLDFLEKHIVLKIQSCAARIESDDPLTVLSATAFAEDLDRLLRKYGTH